MRVWKPPFRMLEGAVQSGRIGAYGIASWNAFRVAPDQPAYMALSHAKALAQRAADGKPDHFHYVQMPLNLAMTEGLTSSTQEVGGKMYSAVRAATLLGLRVMASGAIRQAKLGTLPSHVNKALGEYLTSDAQRALQFTRSAPGVGTALVGLKQPTHVSEALALCPQAPMAPPAVLGMFGKPKT